MHVTVTTADTTGESLDDVRVLAEEIDSWIRDMDGYLGYAALAREGTAIGVAFWESREAAERHEAARGQFRERMLAIAGVRLESVENYEVVFSSLGRGVADAAR